MDYALASSEYFLNLFKWSTNELIKVHNDISGEVLSMLVSYIYSGEIVLNLENTYEILHAANFFSLKELIEDCVNFLIDNMDEYNFLDILYLGYELDHLQLTVSHSSFFIYREKMLRKVLSSFPYQLL